MEIEYFRPLHLWRGKLAYITVTLNNEPFWTLIEVLNFLPGKNRVEIKLPDNTCCWVDSDKVYDKMIERFVVWEQPTDLLNEKTLIKQVV